MSKNMTGKKGVLWFYYIAMLLACIGMSLAFVKVNGNLNYLQLSMISVVAYLIISIIKSEGSLERHDFIMVMLAAIAASIIIIKLIFYGNYLLAAPIITIACFFTIISLLLYSNYEFNYWIYFLINGVGVILLSIGIFVYSYDLWGVVTIGTINPQTLGAWALMYAISALLLFDYFVHKVRHKLLLLIIEIFIIGLMIYFSWITEARFSFVVIVALLIFRVLPMINIFNNKMIRILAGFSPLVMVLVFEVFSESNLLNGREKIWAAFLGKVFNSPLFGIGYNNVDANTFYSHNIFVDQSVLFGVLVPIVFQLCLSYILLKKVPKFSCRPTTGYSTSRLKYDAFLSFWFILISASVESCLFSVGAGGIFLFSFCPLLIALSDS